MSGGTNRPPLIAKTFVMFLALAVTAFSGYAQRGALSPYQGEDDGVSAGGKWMQFRSEDKMTGAKRARFELLSDNSLPRDPDYKPRIELLCSAGKLKQAYLDPGAGLGPPDRPGFWGQPQLEVEVRIDNTHDNHGWNWLPGGVLSMDKGTTRGLIGANIFKVRLSTQSGPQIAEFSPAGLKLDQVKQACDLTPKTPGK